MIVEGCLPEPHRRRLPATREQIVSLQRSKTHAEAQACCSSSDCMNTLSSLPQLIGNKRRRFGLYCMEHVKEQQLHKILLVIASLIFWAASSSVGAVSAQSGIKPKPCTVQRIYVDEFGNDPRYVNFRLHLEKWLAKKKFTVVNKREDADAVLTGALSIGSDNKHSYLAFKDAELKTAGGEKAWSGNFDLTTKNALGWLGRGHIENGAKRIAENIRAGCK